MAKKNKSKQAPQLSPENYIRQKARNLPVYECLVNGDWEKSKMVSVVVSRVHANGNITAGFFLVDLYCLGVKNTTYFFNYSPAEYEIQIQKMIHLTIKKIPYEMAHNIVYAGLDYASELGLNPHKDFTSLTRFILEEDTDDVELIDIECGHKGKPFYIQGQFDSEQMAKRVIAQLERAVGKGNYDFALDGQANENGDKYDDENYEIVKDEFSEFTYQEKKVLFFQLLKSLEIETKTDREKLSDLTISAFKDMVDFDLIDELYDIYKDNLDVSILPIEEIPYELWGVLPGKLTVTSEITDLFIDSYNLLNENTKQAIKKVKALKKIVGDIPAVRLLELLIIQKDGNMKKNREIASDNYATFPKYPLFNLQLLLFKNIGSIVPQEFKETILSLEILFGNRTSLHEIEFTIYVLTLINLIEYDLNATKLEALNDVLEDLDLSESIDEVLYNKIMILKFSMVLEYFSKE